MPDLSKLPEIDDTGGPKYAGPEPPAGSFTDAGGRTVVPGGETHGPPREVFEEYEAERLRREASYLDHDAARIDDTAPVRDREERPPLRQVEPVARDYQSLIEKGGKAAGDVARGIADAVRDRDRGSGGSSSGSSSGGGSSRGGGSSGGSSRVPAPAGGAGAAGLVLAGGVVLVVGGGLAAWLLSRRRARGRRIGGV